jgi:hypothetical protein
LWTYLYRATPPPYKEENKFKLTPLMPQKEEEKVDRYISHENATFKKQHIIIQSLNTISIDWL